MKKREQGVLTIEASLILTVLIFFVLFIFSFARIYRAQNLMSHSVLQTADAIATESFLRETAFEGGKEDVVFLASGLTGATSVSENTFESLRSADLPKIAREKFIHSIAPTKEEADIKLKNIGIRDGVDGIDFSACCMDFRNDDVIIAVKYTLTTQFAVFGMTEVEMTKSAKAKTFGEILFAVTTEPNNPNWGSTTGDTKTTYGSKVMIEANANYGYKFVKWNDGNTQNPREVEVTDAQHYIAIFERDQFGININTRINYNRSLADISHTNYGTTSGAGVYLYEDTATITAAPTEHYVFVGWDDGGDGDIDSHSTTRSIYVNATKKFVAVFEPRTYTVSVRSSNDSYGTAYVSQGASHGRSVTAEYGSRVNLTASVTNAWVCRFNRWSNNDTRDSINVTVRGNDTYTADFYKNTCYVDFYSNGTHVHRAEVIKGFSINSSAGYGGGLLSNPRMPSNPSRSGYRFVGWYLGGVSFSASTQVSGNVRVDAVWECPVTLYANGGRFWDGTDSKVIYVREGSVFNFNSYIPSRSGYYFGGWSGGYSGNVRIYSSTSASANWNCAHPTRRVETSGSTCQGGVKRYYCNTCNAFLGEEWYGGNGGHDFSARCNVLHGWNRFTGNVSGGCGTNHVGGSYCRTCRVTHYNGGVYAYHILCKYCGTHKGTGPYNYCWCANPHCRSAADGRVALSCPY